jgi:hypothetical protein
MPTIRRPSGVVLTIPETYEVSVSPRTRRRAGLSWPTSIPLPISLTPDPGEVEGVLRAMQNQELQLLDQVSLDPTEEAVAPSGVRGASAHAIPPTQTARVEVELASGEVAVLLIQQGGVYSWKFPEEETIAPVRSTVLNALTEKKKRLRFNLEIIASQPKSKDAQRGFLKELVYDRVVAYVLKFVVKEVVGKITKLLERNVKEGIVQLEGLDPASWKRISSLSSLKLPSDRRVRILLFLHGTFSNTVGSFGALCGTPWGKEFLSVVSTNYDAVLGYDHATLEKDPRENASALLEALESAKITALDLDVVSYSRGGLVFRSLTEYLLPASKSDIKVGRAIFVASTNGGTRLAEPQNWHALIDLYTNLAVGVCRVLAAIPQAKAPGMILQEMVQTLGALVKHMATSAVSEGAVPGLAAMEPDGNFVKALNETQYGQPTPQSSNYYAITSEFHPVITNEDHEPKELPRRLVLTLTEGFISQLMHEENDLVVNTSAMTYIDPQAGRFIRDELAFGKTPLVYHTIYFTRPEVTNALSRWLQLTKIATTTRNSRRRVTREVEKKDLITEQYLRQLRMMRIGTMRGPEIPIIADRKILVTPADASAADVYTQISELAPSYVVVSRDYLGKKLHYAFKTEEVLSASTSDLSGSLGQLLSLHETDASNTRSLGGRVRPAPGGGTRNRSVLVSNDRPVGVVPAELDAVFRSNLDLANLAKTSINIDSVLGKVRTRRASRTLEQAAPPPSAGLETTGPKIPLVTCYFHAEMEEEVLLNHATTVEVTVSREILAAGKGPAAATSAGKVQPDRKIILQVIPKAEFVLVENDRFELDPPTPEKPQTFYFDLKAAHVGVGEIWVVARQEQVPLVTLVLKPTVVEKRSEQALPRLQVNAKTPEAPSLEGPLHQLLIVEQRVGNELTYFYQLQSPSLNLFDKYYSKPFLGDRQEYVTNLYNEIEKRWLSTEGDFEAFTNELRAYGAALFSELFPAELQACLWKYREQLESVMVVSTEPFIPWELVYLKDPSKPLKEGEGKFMGQAGLVRWLHQAGWPPTQLQIRQDKAWYVIPDYPLEEYKLPEAALEKKFLEITFHARPIEPQPEPVRRAISEPGTFDLLHFACHGTAEQENIVNAQLVLEGRIEKGQYIPTYFSATTAEGYADLIQDGRRPLVVLNACQLGRSGYKLTGIGGFSQAFIGKGAGVFVGALWSVGDSPAREFTEGFYKSLLSGNSLAKASTNGRETARLAQGATWLAYVVYGHPHAKLSPG